MKWKIIVPILLAVMLIPVVLANGPRVNSIKAAKQAVNQMNNTEKATKILITPNPNPVELRNTASCIKSKLVEGYSREDAIKACIPQQYQKIRTMRSKLKQRNRCLLIRERMRNLTIEISRDPENADRYIPELRKISSEYKNCIGTVKITPVKDECEEYKEFEKIYNETYDEVKNVLALTAAGELNETDFQNFNKSLMTIKHRAEVLKKICYQRTVEPPCKELYALRMVRNSLENILEYQTDPEKIDRINKTIEELDYRISEAKKRCDLKTLKQELSKINRTQDLDESYEAAVQSVIENITEGNMSDEEIRQKIREINQEKLELVKDFVKRVHVLNLERQVLIHRLRVGKKVEVNGVPANISKVNVVIGNKTITITPGSKIKITVSNETAEADFELELVNNTLVDPATNKTIKILPNEIRNRMKKEKINKMSLQRIKGKPVYVVNAEKQGRLLGVIPVRMKVTHNVDPTTGNIDATIKPWWGFLVTG